MYCIFANRRLSGHAFDSFVTKSLTEKFTCGWQVRLHEVIITHLPLNNLLKKEALKYIQLQTIVRVSTNILFHRPVIALNIYELFTE